MSGILREAPRASPRGGGTRKGRRSGRGGKDEEADRGIFQETRAPRGSKEEQTEGSRVDGRKASAREKGRAQEPPQKGGSEKDERDGVVV